MEKWTFVATLVLLTLAALPFSRITRSVLVLSRMVLRTGILGVVAYATLLVLDPPRAEHLEETVQMFFSSEKYGNFVQILAPTTAFVLAGLVIHSLLGVALGEGRVIVIDNHQIDDRSESAKVPRTFSPREALAEITDGSAQRPRGRQRRLSEIV